MIAACSTLPPATPYVVVALLGAILGAIIGGTSLIIDAIRETRRAR